MRWELQATDERSSLDPLTLKETKGRDIRDSWELRPLPFNFEEDEGEGGLKVKIFFIKNMASTKRSKDMNYSIGP